MEENGMKSKILIFGGTGYIGNHMVKGSLKLGHPTYVFSRPNSSKTTLLDEFQSLGAIMVKEELDEHEKLVELMKKVDIVICAFAIPQILDQFKILEAINAAGNIKRFLPSEFGVEEDRITALPPFEACIERKRVIRRAIEEANIPYTYVSANCFASYFVNYLLRLYDPKDEITVYGTGEARFAMNYEPDIGLYTIKVATDPRALNRVVIYRPSTNIITQLELISRWEKKIGKKFKKVHVSEEEIVALTRELPEPENIPIAILHCLFIDGVTMSYEFKENDVEASTLYPELKFTTIDELLDIFMHDPPPPASAAF
uniref:Eugenol synthase n=1 Tax=Ocimum kilimandscharicum TaxID=1224218 RepID=A0A1B2U6T4_9LAMI|nr:eugenol synthase [Ocimum kilimandscharicum]